MKRYGKLEGENLIYAPINYDLEDGVIINFNLNEELMKEYGFKEVVDIVPETTETQHIEVKNYTEGETTITINYKIVENEVLISLEDRVEAVEKENKNQDELINITMMVADEMFSLIEPLLGEVVTLVESNSKIADLYVAMIKRNLKTIDEVPLRYRETIEKHLK